MDKPSFRAISNFGNEADCKYCYLKGISRVVQNVSLDCYNHK